MRFQFSVPTLKSIDEVSRLFDSLVRKLDEIFAQNEILQLVEDHRVPEKVVHGKLYFADGTDWDPGSGRGVYCYDSTGPTWRKLG